MKALFALATMVAPLVVLLDCIMLCSLMGMARRFERALLGCEGVV